MTTQILNVSFQNFPVSFRADGYLNATQIAQSFGKRVQHYLKTERTQEYIAALAEAVFTASGNSETPKSVTAENYLVITQKGGNDKSAQGTWLHPKLAVDFARWLNPKFAVWCDEQIEQILSGSHAPEQSTASHTPQIPNYDYGMARLFVKHGAGVAQVSDLHMALYQLSHIQNTFLKMLEHKALHFKLNDDEKRCLDTLAHWQMAVAKVGANIGK